MEKSEDITYQWKPKRNMEYCHFTKKAGEGAKSQNAEIEVINLYDLDFKGCTSCFTCKLKNGESYGQCALKDELSPLLEKIKNTDGLILGSPLYLGTVTGEMKSFLERWFFHT